jgi:MerR family transcriptional regulator, heat shock protein HspR
MEIEHVSRHPIRTAAKQAGLHPQTLRDYERRGLLRPSRTDGGMRLYSDDEIARAKRLAELTAEGTPLRVARRVLRLEERVRTAVEVIHVLEDQNRRLSDRLRALAAAS